MHRPEIGLDVLRCIELQEEIQRLKDSLLKAENELSTIRRGTMPSSP